MIAQPTEPKPISENDPSVQLRTDLWSSMTTSQLHRQRELILDKLSKLQSIMGSVANPSILSLYSALQTGMEDLDAIVDYKTNRKK